MKVSSEVAIIIVLGFVLLTSFIVYILSEKFKPENK